MEDDGVDEETEGDDGARRLPERVATEYGTEVRPVAGSWPRPLPRLPRAISRPVELDTGSQIVGHRAPRHDQG